METNIREAESAVKQREQAIRSREEALVRREEAIRRREDLVEQREEASIYTKLEAERLRSDLDTELQVAKEKSKTLSNQAKDQAARYRVFEECVQEADRLKFLTAEHARKLTGAAAAAGPLDLPSAATEKPKASLRFTLKRGFEEIDGPSYEDNPRHSPQPPKRTKTRSSASSTTLGQTFLTTKAGWQLQGQPSLMQMYRGRSHQEVKPEADEIAKKLIARMRLPIDWNEQDMRLLETRICTYQDSRDYQRHPLLMLDWCANQPFATCWYQKSFRRKAIIPHCGDTGNMCTLCREFNSDLCFEVVFVEGQKGKEYDPNSDQKRWAVNKRYDRYAE